jgi:hypothetical protein
MRRLRRRNDRGAESLLAYLREQYEKAKKELLKKYNAD